MKIIRADVDDAIIYNTIEDLDTGITTGITSTLKLPTGNLNNILIDFNFTNKTLCECFKLFASFELSDKRVIDVELKEITVGEVKFETACYIPAEVFEKPCQFMLGLWGYASDDNGETKQRISLFQLLNMVEKGSYDPNAKEGIVPTPTVFETYFDRIKQATDEIEDNLKNTMITYKKYESSYITTEDAETEIPIDIEEYVEDEGMLFVKINGLDLIEKTEYTVADKKVTLVNAVDKGTVIHIVYLKPMKEDVKNLGYKIEELEEENRLLLNDHKKIPFNAVSNHLEDTGNLPILDLGINGGIEQDTRVGYNYINSNDLILFNSNKYIGHNDFSTQGSIEVVSNNLYSLVYKKTIAITDKALNLFNSENVKSSATETVTTNGDYTVRKFNTGENTSFSFYLGSDTEYTSVEDFINKSELMLLKGDYSTTTIPTYEQYGAMPSLSFPSEVKGVSGHYDTVVENKNVLKFGNILIQGGGITVEKITENKIKINGTTNTDSRILSETTKKAIGKNMFLSAKVISGSVNGAYLPTIAIYEGNNSWGRTSDSVKLNSTASTKLYEKGLETEIYQIGCWIGKDTVCDNVIIEFQLEYGEVATETVEHQEQLLPIDIPTGKVLYNENAVVELTDAEIEELGLEKAELYFKDEFGKQELNSSLTIARYVVGGFDCYRITGLQNLNNSANAKIKSNIFKGIVPIYDETSSIINRKAGDIYINNVINAIDILTKNGEYADPTSFINAVTGNYFVYQLAKPIYTPIKDENFIKQYRAFQKAHSYKEVTNINSYGSEDDADLVLSGNALMSNDIRLSKLESGV